ncbi:hypothetical protein [Providencia sp.]|uniref:hypothetical protein n=1 Tax=Providencia sp. TaxID=589 RepID=UPI002940F187|nr:hypothetical protein [Providencia rettgeri]
MRKINILAIPLLLSGVSMVAYAESLMRTFSYCDASFFNKVKEYPVLQDISNTLKNTTFNDGIQLSVDLDFSPTGIITFNRFFVSHSDFDKYDNFTYMGMRGQYYFWGFETKQSFDEVIQHTLTKISILKIGKSYIYAPMIRHNLKDKWIFNEYAAQNYSLEPYAAEKMMIIEKDEQRGVVRFLCTLRGNVTKEDLKFVGLE